MLYIALMVFGGCLVALQSPVNAALSRTVGILESSFVSFAGGTLFLGLAVLFFGRGQLMRLPDRWRFRGYHGAQYHHCRAAHWRADYGHGHDFRQSAYGGHHRQLWLVRFAGDAFRLAAAAGLCAGAGRTGAGVSPVEPFYPETVPAGRGQACRTALFSLPGGLFLKFVEQ